MKSWRVATLTLTLTVAVSTETLASAGEAFGKRIEAIVHAVDEVDRFDDNLFSNPEMKDMFSHSFQLKGGALGYLFEHPDLPRTEARVTMATLQCLPLSEYLALIDKLGKAGSGKVSQWVLLYSVSPGIEWSTRLAIGFRQSEVRETLLRLSASPNATRIVKNSIEDILKGRVARYVSREKITPKWQCSAERD